MKTTTAIAALAIGILTIGAANAADLSERGRGIAFVSDSKDANWTGFYFGGQAGYGNTNHNMKATETETYTIPASCSEGSLHNDGKCYDAGTPAYCSKDDKKSLPLSQGMTCKDGWEKHSAVNPQVIEGADIISATTVTDVTSAFLNGFNSSGFFGGGTVGFDFQKDRWVAGVFGQYNFSGADTTAGATFNGEQIFAASIEDGDSWLVGGRLGYLFSPRVLTYGLVGYGQTDMSYNVDAGEFHGQLDKTFSGITVGGGVEYAATRNIFIGIEYQHFFGGKEMLVDAKGFTLTDEIDGDKIMGTVKFKINRD